MLRQQLVADGLTRNGDLVHTTNGQPIGGQMEGQNEEQGTPLTIDQPLLRVKITEGGLDVFEAEGVESMVTHLIGEWRARLDALRADAVSTMERMRGRGGDIEIPTSRH